MTTTTSSSASTPRALPDLDEDERYRAFDALQQGMSDVWAAWQLDHTDESVVVVPSISLDRSTASTGTLVQAMEERALFLLLLLRQPRLQMIYVTSQHVAEDVVEYYLGLLPGVIPRQARNRLTMVSLADASPIPLSVKLLARPRVLREIRELIPNPARSHLIPYNTTPLERDVSLSLGIPMYGADPRLADLGSKTGCRRMFEQLEIPCPAGAEDLRTVDDLVTGLQHIRQRRPGLAEAIVKLNEGVSGSGNALVDLRGLPSPGAEGEGDALRARVAAMALEDPQLAREDYLQALASDAGIVEERISGTALTSPSVQMRAAPDGTVELLSTHDQLLGGSSGQSYLGCVFPADPAYAAAIAEPAMVVGRHLAGLGVIGRFAVDFVTVRDEQGMWTAHAIELNLRKGGTTHPFLTLQFLTDGHYVGDEGRFVTAAGQEKHLVATDHFDDQRLCALRLEDLLDVVATRRLHFDASRQTGIVLHMMSCVTECGRLGLTAVGDSAEQARELYDEAQRVLLDEAERARLDGPLLV